MWGSRCPLRTLPGPRRHWGHSPKTLHALDALSGDLSLPSHISQLFPPIAQPFLAYGLTQASKQTHPLYVRCQNLYLCLSAYTPTTKSISFSRFLSRLSNRRKSPPLQQTLAFLMPVFTCPDVGRRSRSVQARRQAAAQGRLEPDFQAAERLAAARAAGRNQAYQEAYLEAQQRAKARRERPRGPWRQRGSRIVRAEVSDEDWQRLAARAAEQSQPASTYLGQLIRDHLANSN